MRMIKMNKIFSKDSAEMLMFRDFYNIIQKYWVPENTEEYWQGLIDESNAFIERFRHTCPLSRKLIVAFNNQQEEVMKDGRYT